jgi:hypothetical protein
MNFMHIILLVRDISKVSMRTKKKGIRFLPWDKSTITDDVIIRSFMQNPQHMVFHAFEDVVPASSCKQNCMHTNSGVNQLYSLYVIYYAVLKLETSCIAYCF